MNKKFLLFLLTCVIATGCNLTKRVPEGEHLLVKNDIRIDNIQLDKDDLKTILKQKPNRKILGLFRFHLSVYNWADGGNDSSKVRRYFKNTVGEAPVLFDSLLMQKSARQLQLYMNMKGFFNAEVKDTVQLKKKKAKVTYIIRAREPYTIRSVVYEVDDPVIRTLVLADSVNTLLEPGKNYDEEQISAERDRITRMLKNEGFYYFAKEFIHFDVDSALKTNQVKLKVYLKDPSPRVEGADTIRVRHKKYHIRQVYVNTRYSPTLQRPVFENTLDHKGIKFLHNRDLAFKPSVIVQHLFLKPGDLYQVKNVEESYQKLTDLKVFRFINITLAADSTADSLNAYISLSPLVRMATNYEFGGKYSGGNPGIEANITYTNNNLFRGAENLQIRLRGALEAQQVDESTVAIADDKLFFFNTKEFGPEITLSIPRFLLPVKAEKFSKYFTPRTNITVFYNYQSQPYFRRSIVNASYGISWRESRTKVHQIGAELNYVFVKLTEPFQRYLNEIRNPFFTRTFEEHTTPALSYTFTFNNQGLTRARNAYYFRGRFEEAGNLIYGFYKWTTSDTVPYTFFGVPFAQYLKTDIDFRIHRTLHEKHNVAFRAMAGIGLPFKNLPVLPLEKSYFAGGANSIRAWPARSLGPGYFTDTTNILRMGDIQLESNLEYRFDLINILEGALFVDAGNIWLFRQDPRRYGGMFDPRKVLSQIALGTGAGARFDFSFFIIRLDFGLKLHDPMKQEGWVIKNIFNDEWNATHPNYRFWNINLGLGYPF